MEADWLDLVRRHLPAMAIERGWPIRSDHCFARVLLDNAVRGCWYDFVSGRPAYRRASDAQLSAALALGRAAAAGGLDMAAANARSLGWRRQRRRVGKGVPAARGRMAEPEVMPDLLTWRQEG